MARIPKLSSSKDKRCAGRSFLGFRANMPKTEPLYFRHVRPSARMSQAFHSKTIRATPARWLGASLSNRNASGSTPAAGESTSYQRGSIRQQAKLPASDETKVSRARTPRRSG
ncbi:hypothetical protein EVAR_35571_1 [Eumeta japonica]|uniref:Uncharacterized protein n=1 Tax=Eumeta variegata TaxID=151549 RepID=A0A4C1XME6_EUMVA|nr:hypothetical protein EVAR_35571_1 [Eumeta japonica]